AEFWCTLVGSLGMGGKPARANHVALPPEKASVFGSRTAAEQGSAHRVVTPAPVCEMARGEVYSQVARPGEYVRVERGMLWVTQQGDARDYFLSAGQSLLVTRAGKLVLQAMDDSAFRCA
ncbi:MAG TPA: DUF2917 domain-containing protein, partial [Abditibacteriaceae bacterium]